MTEAFPNSQLDSFFAQENGFPGADGIYSYAYRDGLLFYFGDTICRENGGFDLSHNSFLFTGKTLQNPLYSLKRGAFFSPDSDEGSFYWFQDGLLEGDVLYAFALRVKNDPKAAFLLLGSDILKIDVSSYPEPRLIKRIPLGKPSLLYGNAVLKEGNYYYVFCYTDTSPKRTILARTASLDEPSFSYLQEDGSYAKEIGNPRVLSTLLGAENKVYQCGGRYYLAYSPGGISKEIRLTSFSSLGDLIPEGELIYLCPEHQGEDICYNAKIQPALSNGKNVIVSYNVNSTREARVKETGLYHPHFLEVSL